MILSTKENDETMETLIEYLQLNFLGGLDYAFAGASAPLAKPTRALMAFLALAATRPQSRAKLAALLWADRSEGQARTSLRQALTQIRRLLGKRTDEMLLTNSDSVCLLNTRIRVDAIDLE